VWSHHGIVYKFQASLKSIQGFWSHRGRNLAIPVTVNVFSTASTTILGYYVAPGKGAKYSDEYVCCLFVRLSVCLSVCRLT